MIQSPSPKWEGHSSSKGSSEVEMLERAVLGCVYGSQECTWVRSKSPFAVIASREPSWSCIGCAWREGQCGRVLLARAAGVYKSATRIASMNELHRLNCLQVKICLCACYIFKQSAPIQTIQRLSAKSEPTKYAP